MDIYVALTVALGVLIALVVLRVAQAVFGGIVRSRSGPAPEDPDTHATTEP